MSNEERIKADAEAYAEKENSAYVNDYNGYIAGATAENERAQVLVDALVIAKKALEYSYDVLSYPADGKTMQDQAIQGIETALEQWKGKPDRPCPHCGKELSRDRNLCCRECGEEVEPTNDKCRCVQPNWNAFTGKCLTCGKP